MTSGILQANWLLSQVTTDVSRWHYMYYQKSPHTMRECKERYYCLYCEWEDIGNSLCRSIFGETCNSNDVSFIENFVNAGSWMVIVCDVRIKMASVILETQEKCSFSQNIHIFGTYWTAYCLHWTWMFRSRLLL